MTSAAADLAAVADVGLLDPAWAGSRAEAATADRTFLGHLLDVEAAWVRVLARHGLATEAEAAAAAAAGDPDAYDLAALARAAQGGGTRYLLRGSWIRQDQGVLTGRSWA